MLYLAKLFGGDFLEMREVKSKHFGRNKRTFLLNMSAEHLAECLMKQVGCRVVARCGQTGFLVDGGDKLSVYIGRKLV